MIHFESLIVHVMMSQFLLVSSSSAKSTFRQIPIAVTFCLINPLLTVRRTVQYKYGVLLSMWGNPSEETSAILLQPQ